MLGLLIVALVSVAAGVVFSLAAQIRLLRREIAALTARLDGLEGHPAHRNAQPVAAEAIPGAPEPAVVPEPLFVPPPAPPVETEAESLESRIGGQWLLYVGVIAILVGIAYFEKLAFENDWMGPAARMVQTSIAGGALVYAGVRFARAGYRLYGQAIAGMGIAVLYVSAYASFNFYHLVSRPVAFACMLAITVFGDALAERQASQGLAVLAVGGGFATPFLLPGTTDAEVALFGYDLILAAGTAALARRRAWGLLYGTSYILVLLTVAAWAQRFYTPAKYVTTELFLTAFCALFLYTLRRCRATPNLSTQIAGMFLLTSPVAYYFVSLAVLFEHPLAMLVWLVALTTVIALASVRLGALVGLAGTIAVTGPLIVWCAAHASSSWLATGLSATAGIYGLSLAAQLHLGVQRESPSHATIGWVHLAGLTAYAAIYLLILPVRAASAAAAAFAFAVWQIGIASVLWHRWRALATHFVALGGTLVAIAIALEFNGAAVTVGWGAEGFALVVLALRERRPWLRAAGLLLFVIAVARAESLLFAEPRMGQLVLLNRRAACAAFLIALAYGLAWLHASRGERGAYVAGAIILAQVLTLSLVTSEIDAFWLQRREDLTRQVMRSISWAVYATALILVGLRRSYAPVRVFAIAVLGLTAVKVFAVDLQHLQRVYRVVSVIGLGIMLLMSSYLYQRARSGTAIGPADARWPRARNGHS